MHFNRVVRNKNKKKTVLEFENVNGNRVVKDSKKWHDKIFKSKLRLRWAEMKLD